MDVPVPACPTLDGLFFSLDHQSCVLLFAPRGAGQLVLLPPCWEVVPPFTGLGFPFWLSPPLYRRWCGMDSPLPP